MANSIRKCPECKGKNIDARLELIFAANRIKTYACCRCHFRVDVSARKNKVLKIYRMEKSLDMIEEFDKPKKLVEKCFPETVIK